MTEQLEQWICIKFCFKLEHSSVETTWLIQKATPTDNWDGSFITTRCLLMQQVSSRVFSWNIKSPRWLSTPTPRFGALQLLAFPQNKITLKGRRFQTVNEIQENTMGQLLATGRTVWGPKVPTLKGTEVSLSYVQCFLYLVSSSINTSIFHITWLDIF